MIGTRPAIWFILAAIVLAAPPAATRTRAAAADAGAVAEPPAAVVIEGTPRERGEAYGTRFRAAIRAFLDEEIYAPFDGKPSSREEMLGYAAACGRVLREACPLVAAEIEGMATGARLSYEEIVLIHLHEELYHRTELPKQGHCTAVAVGPPSTGNGRTYVGQTWDWMQSVAGKSRVIEWRRGEAASVLAYGFPGMPMGAGLNSAGIALCWTSAGLDGKNLAPRVGIPSYALIAHLLAQKDLESVIREARKDRHAGWFTFVMADGSGNLVNIEGSPAGVAVERRTDQLARVGYGTREMTGAGPGQPVPVHARCRKMDDLLRDSRGKNDLARLQEYFAQPGHAISVGKGTIDMMVFDTTARRAYLSRGPSYRLAWREFAFGTRE